jgi:hypothetical protein
MIRASGRTIPASLPPSSLEVLRSAPMTSIPARTLPVRLILRTAGLATSSRPAVSRSLVTALITTGGSARAIRSIVCIVASDECSAGLITTVLPASRA